MVKVIIPFEVPHNVDPKEDYFELCRDVCKGEFLSVKKHKPMEIIREIAGEKVHSHGRGLPFPEMAGFFAKSSVYTLHNNHLGASKLTQTMRSFFFNRYDWIAAQTEYGRRCYIKEGIDPKKIVVLPIPINYKVFSKPRGGERFRKKFGLGKEPYVFCINARRTKNPEVIIEACKKVGMRVVFANRKSMDEVGLGFEWMLPEKEVLDMQGEDVIITGNVGRNDILGAFDGATMFVNSSDDGGECFSLATYEAAAAGVPMCLADFGVFDAFKGAALFHGNHDSDQLAENMQRYLDDPKLMKSNARKAREIAKRFDYPVVRKMYEKFYRKIGFVD